MSGRGTHRFKLDRKRVEVRYETNSFLGVTNYTAIVGDREISGRVNWPWNTEGLEEDIRRQYSESSH